MKGVWVGIVLIGVVFSVAGQEVVKPTVEPNKPIYPEILATAVAHLKKSPVFKTEQSSEARKKPEKSTR